MRIRSAWLWHYALMFVLLASPTWAVQPDEILADQALEARARAISAEVRCVVCQNEAIDTSSSGVARDLRILVRERLSAGDTDNEVKEFLVARYGDFVLFRPPMRLDTAILWFAPFLLLLIGLYTVVRLVRRRTPAEAESLVLLDAEEAAAFDQLDRRLTGREQ